MINVFSRAGCLVLERKPRDVRYPMVSGKLSKRRFWYASYTIYPIVISTSGRNLQGCRKYPHQPRFLALLGMTTEGKLKNIRFQKKTFKTLPNKRFEGFHSSTVYDGSEWEMRC
jgi:hypothetical protein